MRLFTVIDSKGNDVTDDKCWYLDSKGALNVGMPEDPIFPVQAVQGFTYELSNASEKNSDIIVSIVKLCHKFYQYVVSVGTRPVAITESTSEADKIVNYLKGEDVIVDDLDIQKTCDSVKQDIALYHIGIGMPNGTYNVEVKGVESAWETYQKTKAALSTFTEVTLMDSSFKVIASSHNDKRDLY